MRNDTRALTLLLIKGIRLKKNIFRLLLILDPFRGAKLLTLRQIQVQVKLFLNQVIIQTNSE
jgi:hypothetical protein